jgi:16S rRNA (uracil1498-N3)-methyltransferase
MLPRFYAPDADDTNDELMLSSEESRHAIAVLRLNVADELIVFDGRGREWRAHITSASKSGVRVRRVAALVPAPEPRIRVTLVQAVLKKDHMDAVIRDATMLGVAAIQPVITAHTVVIGRAAASEGARARWLRVAVASAKQCRRAVVPEIGEAVRLQPALQIPMVAAADVRILLAEPTAGAESRPMPTPAEAATLAVGPEGGWSREDLDLFARAGFVSVTLGPLTLRADAAAVVAISALRERWGDLGRG